MSVPTQCQQLAEQVQALEQERNGLQDDLHEAAPGAKAGLVAQIRILNRQISAGRDQLLACIANNPPVAPQSGLAATFTGEASITTTHTSAPGPYVSKIQLGLLFDDARTSVQITAFPPIVTEPFNTPYGANVTTVTKTGGGVGSYAGGNAAIPLKLRFDQSIDLPFYEEDSDLSVGLSTDAPGSPVDAEGNVVIAGSGVFQKGVLGGSTGTLVITGKIAPVP
jgi:hypothetical protein